MGALGVPPDSKGAGCTPVEHRRAIQGLFENTGILYGLDVTGTSGLEYNVGAGAAVCQRNAQDGYSIAWSDGGRVTAPEGGAGGVDVVWIRANDASQGDSDNSVQLGCSRGAAPAGCVPIAYRQAPAGSSATESRPATGDRVDYAKPVFCQVVIGQCGVSFPSEKAVGFSPVRNWPVIARVLLFHCIRA